MKKAFITAAVFAALATPVGAQAQDTVLEFETMAGVSGPFRGSANPIRGIPGGGLAWRLEEAKGELKRDGRLEVHVRGLVLAEGANEGRNPIADFRAIVSCRVIDQMGAPAFVNQTTGLFPASPMGDSDIEAKVALPSHCFAPLVFVTSPTGSWFAVTGF
jgi:hypothetical protein